MDRRGFLATGAALAGTAALGGDEKTTDGGYAPVSWADRVDAPVPVLPAGAGDARRFARTCVGCGLCVAACPSQCLRPGPLGRPALDFRHGWCRPTCVACGEACPSGAIAKIGFAGKRTTHVGRAVVDAARCVRTTAGDECHACEKHCPVKAVTIVGKLPVVDAVACLGCGACEHYCPARPKTAIRVEGYAAQRTFRPMSEADLAAEMRAALKNGKAAVLARRGVIVAQLEGRGVRPLLDALAADPKALSGVTALDRVVGRAAAAIYVVGGAAKVVAPVMSEGAKALLEKHGVAAVADTLVKRIENREHSGMCPMDSATADLDEPSAIVRTLRTMLK